MGHDIAKLVRSVGGFESLSAAEDASLKQAYSLLAYTNLKSDGCLRLVWWYQPAPGNFGDWLSPYIFAKLSGKRLQLVRPQDALGSKDEHYFGVGSIGKFAGPKSILLGTGISSIDATLDSKADYRMVRGPITRSRVIDLGGACPEVYGDPALCLPRLYKPKNTEKIVQKYLLVRHFCHVDLDVTLSENVDEASILVSHPEEIEKFIDCLHQYSGVVTSAMHCLIVCQSYGIPCLLVNFLDNEMAVHGDGIKYLDYQQGAQLEAVEPLMISSDLNDLDIPIAIRNERVLESVIDNVYRFLCEELLAVSQSEKL